MLVATFARAQVYIETDLTSQFSALTNFQSWTGATGFTATDFCPMVEVNGLGQKQVCEKYVGTCNETGDVFNATVNGLSAGTYKIELYGAAAYTFGRGFTSTAFSEGTWNAGDKIEPTDVSTGVTLYAESEGLKYGGEIPIYYAQAFPDGAATVTLSGIVVGQSGSIKIGMSKTSTSTNWHVIQLKGVTAQMDANDALAVAVASANAVNEADVPASVYSALQTAVSENNKTYETAEEYQAAIAAINAAVSKANLYAAASAYFAKMGAVLENTNVYSEEAYNAVYGTWLANYEAGTLDNEVLASLNADKAYSNGWHSSNNIDDILLSTWTIGSDQAKDYDKALYINTWSVEGDNDGTGFKVPFFEYWIEDTKSLGENTLTATLENIPAGNYAVEAWVRVRMKNGATAPATGITFQANDGKEASVADFAQVGTSQFYIKNVRVPAVVGEDGKLVAKFNVAADNNISWLSFQNVNYITAEEAAQKELAENYASAQAALIDGNYYQISTMVGEDTYYLKSDGKLTAEETEATNFLFKAVNADGTAYATGWNLGSKFTNPTMSGSGGTGDPVNEGGIKCENKNDRNNYERQVFFLNQEGEYAVRATNASGTAWGANTFWTALTPESELPQAGYSLTESYVWNLKDVTAESILADAQATVNAAKATVEAKANVGTGLFEKPEEAYNTYSQAVADAETAITTAGATVDDIKAAIATLEAATTVYNAAANAPKEGQAYVIANTTATGNLSIETGSVKVKTDATVYFTAVEGGFVLSNENDEYIFKTTNNNWTLSTTTDIAEAYKVNINAVEGGFTIQGEKGLFGLDNADEGSAVYANKTAANHGVWTIAEYVEPGPEPVIADVTQDLFFEWDGVDAEAQKTSDTPTGCDYKLNTSTDMVYGTSTVTHTKYADLSEWDYLTIAAPQGTPRLQFNRKTADGQDHVKIPDNADDVEKYIKKSEDGTFIYDLAAIKADWGFVHLNAIKTSGGPGIIQEMKLSTVKPYEPTWYTISVAEGIENGTVEATLTKSVAGAPVSVTATPAEGFELKAIKYTAEGEEPTTQEGTTFTMPAANVTVSATFTKAPEYIVSDLTKAMFHDWSAADGTAEIITEEAACDYAIGDVEAKAEGTALYGNGNVLGQSFADLSEYKSLALDVESGAIRIMLNTVGQSDPKTFIELNNGTSKPYFSINGNTWTVDFDKFKETENVEYVHLNVIKVAWGSSAAISAAKLTKLAEETPTLYTITIAETENGTVETDVREAEEGATVTVTVTPNDGFMVDEVSLTYGEGQKVEFDGEPTENEGVLSATFTMPAGNVNVGFTFKKVEYDITVAGATPSEEPGAYLVEGGKISISSDAYEGEEVTISLGPDEGYEVESVSVTKTSDGSEVTPLTQDPDYQTNWIFIMPGEPVTVTAVFKRTSTEPVEPETPTYAATLTHTASSSSASDATVFTSTVDAEKEHVNNAKFGNTWAGAAYADFSVATLPAGASITKATLTFTAIGENRRARATDVLYVNAGAALDYDALATGTASADLAATRIQSVDFPQTPPTDSQKFEIDATEALNTILAAGQKNIIFKWTGNQGGGDVAGKASENAPTLIIEYIPGAPEIANASFELDGEKAASNSALELTGWTFGGVGTQFNNTELRPAESESTTSQFGTSNPSDGEYSLFFRQGWNGDGNTITLTSDALTEIPAGDYVLSVDYKQHYSHDGSTNENTKVGISLVSGENTLGSETSPAAAGVQGGSADNTYFNDTEWSTLEASFTIAEAVPAGAQVVITLNAGGQRRSDFFLDNVQFTKVPGIELALIELKKAIEAAEAKKATYGVGDGLFQYPASEIEPLTQAIATAQGVYDAPESKEAVEAATTDINTAVEQFAPVQTTPDPDQLYTLALKTSDEASPFELSVSTDGIKIVAAGEGTPVSFVAQEGGTYAISNGTEYVNYEGSNNWTMAATADAYGWTIATVEGGYTITGKNGFLGTNTSDGNAADSPCYGDKKANNGNYIWGIAEYVEPTEKTIEIAIERMVGLGYSEQNETMDFAAAAKFLGVEAVTNDMLRVMKSDNTLTDSYGTYDGWFNKEGFAETWGANSFINIKLWRANDEGKYSIQDMGGDQGAAVPAVGDKVTVKWAAVANEKTVFFNFNVTFVEIPVPELTISDVKVQKDVIYDNTVTSNYVEQIVELTDDEVQTILTELNLTSLDEAKVYGYNPSDESFVVAFAGFDGWRDANGDFAMHTGTTDVPACCKYTDGKSYPCYNIAGVGDKIVKTYWAIANDEKAVLVEVDFWFGDAYTGIDGIASGGKAKANGKYLENGKIFIYRNGKKFSTTGVELK